MVIPRDFPVVFASKKEKSDRKPSQKRKKTRKRTSPFRPKFTLFGCAYLSPNSATNALDLFCASRLLAFAAIPTALAGIAAVTLGVGRFGVIVEQQLQ
jgi:hypothetical protein